MDGRNLREMLAEAKDTSELMVDLAYASLYFDDPDMADEVDELEQELSKLVHAMRTLCIIAVRQAKEAEAMSAVLQVVSAVERIGNDAVDVAKIVTARLGIPRALLVDLSEAEEVAHRVEIATGSHFSNRPLGSFELPVVTGLRVMAIRRSRRWIIDPDGDEILQPNDVMFLRGSPAGIPRLRELAGAPAWVPPVAADESGPLSDLDRAIDVLVEMKNLSEVAVGLAYSALVLRDRSLAAEVRHLEDRLDEMNHRLETWVLRAAADGLDPAPLRGLLHLGAAAEDIGDQAKQMVWLVEGTQELHPILAMALGDTDDVVVRIPVAPGCAVAGRTLGELSLPIEPGFSVLAIEREGRYAYRPGRLETLRAGDGVLASGPEEGREALAELFGWRIDIDEEDGEISLEPLED